MRSFNELSKKNKILMVVGAILLASLLVWLAIAALSFLFDTNIVKSFKGYFSVLGSKNGGLYFLASIVVCSGVTIFMYVRYHHKLGGKIFDSNKRIEGADYSAKWLDQKELEENIIVLKDDITPSYPTWCIEGVEGITDSHGKSVGGVAYHILANDKFCLQQDFKKEGKEPLINNGKLIKNLIAGATITIGGAGSGKTKQIIKPSILHLLKSKCRSSMVICDLKGDIFKMTSKIAETNGYKVLRFNTTNAKFSHSWNSLGEIWDLYYDQYLPNWKKCYDEDYANKNQQLNRTSSYSVNKNLYLDAKSKIQTKLDIIVKTISPTNDDPRGQFFDQSAQGLLKLYFLLLLDYGIKKDEYTIFNVANNSITYTNKLTVLTDMIPQWALSAVYAAQFPKINEDVLRTVNTKLESFIVQEIKNLTTPNEASIDFDKFITEPTVLYISIDVTTKDSSANKLAVLFMEMLYAHLQSYLTKNNLSYFDKPILFIIDEFGNLPKMEFMLKMFSLDRGKNIVPHLVLQSPSQLNRKYGKEDRRELFDSCQCFILCSGMDVEFAQWLSDKSGTDYRKTIGKNITEEGKVSHSENKQRMDNIPKGEFANIKPGKEIIIVPTGLRACKINITPAENVKWIKDVTISIEEANDTIYGVQNNEEIEYIRDILNHDIINLWISRNNNRNVPEYKRNTAGELSQMPAFSTRAITSSESERMNEFFNKNGGYPCLALTLINKMPEAKSDAIDVIEEKKQQIQQSHEPKFEKDEDNREKNIEKRIKQATRTISDKNFANKDSIKNIHVRDFIFLLGIIGLEKLQSKFKSEQEFNNFIDKIKESKKYSIYWELYDLLPDKDLTINNLYDQFRSIFEITVNESNVFYIVKLIDLMIFAYQNTPETEEEAENASNEVWDKLAPYFKISCGKEMEKKYYVFKDLSIEISNLFE